MLTRSGVDMLLKSGPTSEQIVDATSVVFGIDKSRIINPDDFDALMGALHEEGWAELRDLSEARYRDDPDWKPYISDGVRFFLSVEFGAARTRDCEPLAHQMAARLNAPVLISTDKSDTRASALVFTPEGAVQLGRWPD